MFNIIIDQFTHSIQEVATGISLETQVIPVDRSNLKMFTKKKGWFFNWRTEFNTDDGRTVLKLVTPKAPGLIHGLVSYKKSDGFYFITLIESAPCNRGKEKLHFGVPGNLVAYVCKQSFESGFHGVVAFTPKTRLISHYERTLGAVMINRTDMAIFTKEAKFLVNLYYKDSI